MISTLVLAGAPVAYGEQGGAGPAANSADASAGSGEIVVTAEKRRSTVQKVPISITAVTGDQLQALGLSSAQQVVKAVPGISVNSAGPGQARYTIRGLSPDGGEAATVGFYLDDVPVTPPSTATTGKSPIDPNLYDLSRVEVLRGPQGTLYGAGSMGGTVKLVTNSPDPTKYEESAEAIGSGTQGGGANVKGSGMVNVPLVKDQVALRVVGTFQHDSGWLDRVVVPDFPVSTDGGTTRGNVVNVPGSKTIKDVNDTTLYNVRASILAKLTDQLTITPSFMIQDTHQGGQNTYDGVPGAPYYAHFQPYDIAEPYNDRFIVGSLPIVYDFGSISLTSVTSYWDRHSSQVQDATEQFAIYAGYATPGAISAADGGPGPSSVRETDVTHQFSQEVRLASSDEGRLHWLLGAYYSNFYDEFHLYSAPPGTEASFGTPVLYDVYEPLRVKQYAVFGNLAYSVTDKLKVEAGARYFDYNSQFGSITSGALYGPLATSSTTAKAHGINPMADVSYQITPKVMVYATASKGFREGAGNFPISTAGVEGAPCLASLMAIGRTSAPLSFNPDTVWNFEVGEKARAFGNKVTFNSDIYLINWDKVQTPVALSCGLGFTTNGPKAQVKGFELESSITPVKGLTITQNVGYADGKYVQDYAPALITDGQPLLNDPHWTISTIVRIEQPLDDRHSLVFLTRNNYTSQSYDLSYQINRLPSRDDLASRIGVETDRWTAYLFMDNVLNQHQILSNINTLSYTAPPYNKIATNQPRTMGIDVSMKF